MTRAGHPCDRHPCGHHGDACLTGPCGFCATELSTIASGECRSCLRIVCEAVAGYDPGHEPVCAPCANPGTGSPGPDQTGPTPPDGYELHRLCVFVLSLSCGHRVTYFTNGWYPVRVPCCDRLGGTTLRGVYMPYASDVDCVDVVSVRYEHRPPGSSREPGELRGRRPRTGGTHRKTARQKAGRRRIQDPGRLAYETFASRVLHRDGGTQCSPHSS